MSRVRLRVDDFDNPANPRYRYHDPGRGPQRVPVLRLVTTVLVGPNPAPAVSDNRPSEQALIDTGAWLTVIRYDAWQDYERQGLLERLGPPIPTGARPNNRLRIAGTETEFEFGRVRLAVIESPTPGPTVAGGRVLTRGQLPAVPVLAKLLMDPEARLPLPILLGMHHGVLEGRRLRRIPVPPSATPGDRTDVGQRYGQVWWLDAE